MRNSKTVKLSVTRTELCNLITACGILKRTLEEEGHSAEKWTLLYDELKAQLNAFDSKLDVE